MATTATIIKDSKASPAPYVVRTGEPIVHTSMRTNLQKEVITSPVQDVVSNAPIQHVSNAIMLEPQESIALYLNFSFESRFPIFCVCVDDDLFGIEQCVRTIDEDTHLAKLVLFNRTKQKRAVTVYWQ